MSFIIGLVIALPIWLLYVYLASRFTYVSDSEQNTMLIATLMFALVWPLTMPLLALYVLGWLPAQAMLKLGKKHKK